SLHPTLDPIQGHVFVPSASVAVVVHPIACWPILPNNVGRVSWASFFPLHQHVLANAVRLFTGQGKQQQGQTGGNQPTPAFDSTKLLHLPGELVLRPPYLPP